MRAHLANDKVFFVLVNVSVNVVLLVRSYVAMRVLDHAELGVVALLQSIMLLVAALQLGVLNGGYRLMCSADSASARRINNLVYTCITLLALVCLACALAAVLTGMESHLGVVVFGVLAGIFTLVKNWMTNQMIAKVMLRKLNRINLWSAMASVLVLMLVELNPLIVCLASVVLQPLVFAASVLAGERHLRPDGLTLSSALFRQVFASGFVLFLTGVFVQVNSQLERWYILDGLGLQGLGHFYLPLLFVTIYQLVPSSLDAIFLPRLVRAHSLGDHATLRLDLRRFLLVTAAYSGVAVAGVCLLAGPLLEGLLPKYLPDLRYVYIVLPGLVVLGLASPFAIVFNVLIQYRLLFWAYGLGTLATVVVLAISMSSGTGLDLDGVSTLKSAVYGLIALATWLGYRFALRSNPEFRFSKVAA